MNVIMTLLADRPVKNRTAAWIVVMVGWVPAFRLLAPEFWRLTPKLQVSRTFSLPPSIFAIKNLQPTAIQSFNKLTK
jgi:hypothetical protein